MSVKTNLGAVTAYADAVAAGYTGTREQWAEDMAKLGDNVAEVREAVTAANTAKNDAETARDEANQTVENATLGIGMARDAAVATIGEARDAAVSNVNAAGDAKIAEIEQSGVGGAVRFDTTQTLTEAQQAQARENAGAAGYDAYEMSNRYYDGVDLTVKFADEIAASPYNGDPWAWIKARITAADYKGLHVNDYIPWTATNGKKVKSCIAGFDTYRKFADTNIGHHIDFISRDLWYEKHVMNSVNFNNGITKTDGTAVEHPWLASDLYHWLNALAGEVPGGTAVGGAPVAVDYTTTGVYAFLPDELKAVIVQKRVYLPKRYSASGNLTSDNAGAWMDIGNLWVPAEMEVAGAPIWGDAKYGAMSFIQYPIFNCNANRIKGLGDGGSRSYWWTLSATTGSTTYFIFVHYDGFVANLAASYPHVGAPVCFRIA